MKTCAQWTLQLKEKKKTYFKENNSNLFLGSKPLELVVKGDFFTFHDVSGGKDTHLVISENIPFFFFLLFICRHY